MLKHIFQVINLLLQIVDLLRKLLTIAQDLQPSGLKHNPGKQRSPYLDRNGEACGYTEAELMTVDEALHYLRISRDKLTRMRKCGDLTSFYQKRNVRLIRAEVEKASRWYRKGGS